MDLGLSGKLSSPETRDPLSEAIYAEPSGPNSVALARFREPG
jgi:hypothetical protein